MTGTPPPASTSRTHEEILDDAVRVLTEAARLTRPVLKRDDTASAAAGHPVWVQTGQREPADWAEFVTLALAGAAANIGGIEAALRGRPGSWEADGVRNLLTSTVGHDEEHLHEHRTEPVEIAVYVDELMVEHGVWKAYDDAQGELTSRYDAIGLPHTTGAYGTPAFEAELASLPSATQDQERRAAAIGELEDRLERQREQDWAAYSQALQASIEAAAARVEGLRVPVVVHLDLETFRSDRDSGDPYGWTLADRLLEQALEATPLPGDGLPPLQRLQDTA